MTATAVVATNMVVNVADAAAIAEGDPVGCGCVGSCFMM